MFGWVEIKMYLCRTITIDNISMKLRIGYSALATAILLLLSISTTAKTADFTIFDNWQAGKQTTLNAVKDYGIDRCFAIDTISDKVFARMWKKSYKEGCTIPRSSLRYLRVLHYTINGNIQLGELVCNKRIAADLVDIFRELFNAKYPIERMVLIDNYGAQDEPSMAANNTSCFNFRFVSGTRKLSNHSRGLSIDINPLYNPYVKTRANGSVHVEPKAGKKFTDRTKKFAYKIDRNDLCYKLFIKHGFTWGGAWKRVKDYQHFEKTK